MCFKKIDRLKEIENQPKIMFSDINESEYKLELELLDRFLKFSSELLRLSLLGIVVVGFIITNFLQLLNDSSRCSKFFLIFGIISLALSSTFSLIHRYLVTDAFRFFCFGLRIQKNDVSSNEGINEYTDKDALEDRLCLLKFGPSIKILSSTCLLIGAILISIAFIIILF